MKNSIKKITTLLFGVCLSGLVSVAHADWYNCANAANHNNGVLGSGDYVCCQGLVDSEDLSSLQITQGDYSGHKLVCVAKHNAAWVWTDVGREKGCYQFWQGHETASMHAYRCEQQ